MTNTPRGTEDSIFKDMPPIELVCFALAVSFSLVQLFYSFFGRIGTMEMRSVHLMFAMCLAFFPSRKDGIIKFLADALLIVLALVVGIYMINHYADMQLNMSKLSTTDIVMGLVATVLVLEGTRRRLGLVMPILAVLFLLYGYYGYIIPGRYGHAGYSLGRIVSMVYGGVEGIYGTPLGTMVNTIFLFLVFGAFLQVTGGGEFFIDFAKSLAGKSSGGPAKIAVVSSMLFGSISGSAIANTVATGSFTIPMMKRVGYRPSFAGAVEAVSSTGGQMMPPIMGAGAFVMAELSGIPYSKIVLVSIFPAFLFYLSVFLAVHFEARKVGLLGLPADEIPAFQQVMRDKGVFSLPLLILLVLLLAAKFSVEYSAIFSVFSLILIGLIKLKGKRRWEFILDGLKEGASSAVTISMACASAGIIVAIVSLTGVGFKFSNALFNMAAGDLLLGLALVFVMGLILGMGLPVIAAFIVMISVAGPGLMQLGLPILTAYLIVFWFSQTSNITPPVCMAAYAAAGIAKAKPFETGLNACRIGFPIFIIPLMMAYRPLLLDGPAGQVILTFAASIVCVIALCAFFEGFLTVRLSIMERIIAFAAGASLFYHHWLSDVIGFGLFAVLVVIQIIKRHNRKDSNSPDGNQASPELIV